MILKNLIDCIVGDWFISDGALLGIIRQQYLLNHDDDIDIYLLPNSYIDTDKLHTKQLNIQKYYVCDKVYSHIFSIDQPKGNKWREYCSYISLHHTNLNRADLYKKAKETYQDNSINIEFTKPNIDIFYLDNNYHFDFCGYTEKFKYIPEEIYPIKKNYDLGFTINIPNDSHSILKRLYGNNYMIEDKDFKHF